MFKEKPRLISVVLLFCWCGASTANNQLQTLKELIKSNPQLALTQAQEMWGERPSLANYDMGLLLVKAFMANKDNKSASAQIQQMSAINGLNEVQKALLLTENITLVRQAKEVEQLKTLTDQAKLMIGQFESQKIEKGTAQALYSLNQALGFVSYFNADFMEAEPYFLQAYKYIDKNEFAQVSNLLNTLGVVYAQQAKLTLAAQYMLDSIKMLEDNNLPVNTKGYQNLGSLYFGLKDYDKTIEYSQKALDLLNEKNQSMASLYSNIAAAYVEKEDLNMAVTHLEKSIAISTDLGSTTATARNNLGYIYNQLGEHEKALAQLNLSELQLDDEANADIRGVLFKSKGDVYAAMQDYGQAIKLYEQAYQNFSQHDLKLKRVELYPKMIEVLEQQGNFQRAFEVMAEFKALNDEITDVEATKQVSEILTGFELEKKEQALINSELEREKQLKDIDLLNSKNAFEQKIRYLMIVLVVCLLGLLYLVYRSWRFRGQVNQVLLDKNSRIEKQHRQLIELNSQLKTQTEIDTLTGLKNRRFITQLVAEESIKKTTSKDQWCLIVIDIDDFKTINDRFGHQRGDRVLVQFSQCLKQSAGAEDVVARWGGEEFLWLAKMTSESNGLQRCEALQRLLAEQNWFKSEERSVTCSMGFVRFPLVELNFEDWEAALRLADYGLYQAKNSGKNQWYGFEIVDQKIEYSEINDVSKLLRNNRIKTIKKSQRL